MSINDFPNKIKGKLGIDNSTIMYLLVIIGVAICSFGLGRLSIDSNSYKSAGIVIEKTKDFSEVVPTKKLEALTSSQNIKTLEKKRYVASKNGKLYYSLGCSGSKRILTENQIWFETSLDAEKSGYKPSSSCK